MGNSSLEQGDKPREGTATINHQMRPCVAEAYMSTVAYRCELLLSFLLSPRCHRQVSCPIFVAYAATRARLIFSLHL